jgi:hypothetical protein
MINVFEILITSMSGHTTNHYFIDFNNVYSVESFAENEADKFCLDLGYVSCSYKVKLLDNKSETSQLAILTKRNNLQKQVNQLQDKIIKLNNLLNLK